MAYVAQTARGIKRAGKIQAQTGRFRLVLRLGLQRLEPCLWPERDGHHGPDWKSSSRTASQDTADPGSASCAATRRRISSRCAAAMPTDSGTSIAMLSQMSSTSCMRSAMDRVRKSVPRVFTAPTLRHRPNGGQLTFDPHAPDKQADVLFSGLAQLGQFRPVGSQRAATAPRCNCAWP